jgi:RHS repeat-associated protein
MNWAQRAVPIFLSESSSTRPMALRATQEGSLGTAKAFTGQEADPLTGLYYYQARYYDPVSGQFLSADSVQGNGQGMDPYAYVGNNPESWTDPTGQRASDCANNACDGEGGAGGGGGTIGGEDGSGGESSLAEGSGEAEAMQNEERAGEEQGMGESSLDENDPAENIEAEQAQTRALEESEQRAAEAREEAAQQAEARQAEAREASEAQGETSEEAQEANEQNDHPGEGINEPESHENRTPPNDTHEAPPETTTGSNSSETTVSAPDFVVTPQGEVIPVPHGAAGPFLTDNNRGFQFTGGSGIPGLYPNVSSVRIMDPTLPRDPSPGYPGGYVSYENSGGQTINPVTSIPISRRDPWWHIPLLP